MGATKRALFERCPLCRKGVIEMGRRKTLAGAGVSVEPCPTCGAVFSASGVGRYRLGYCDPRRLASAKGRSHPRSVCSDCNPLAECWIGRALSKSEWEAVAESRVLETWITGPNYDAALQADFWPAHMPESVLVYLREDEEVRHSSVVYLSEVANPGDLQDEAQLLLTSGRLVIVHQSIVFDIRLADIEKVESSFPGFVITAKGVGYPLHCFPAPGDPVYHAILGALKRIH